MYWPKNAFASIRHPNGQAIYFTPVKADEDPEQMCENISLLPAGCVWLSLTAARPHGVPELQSRDERANLRLKGDLIEALKGHSGTWIADSLAWDDDGYFEVGFTVQFEQCDTGLRAKLLELALRYEQLEILEYHRDPQPDRPLRCVVFTVKTGEEVGSLSTRTMLATPHSVPIWKCAEHLHLYPSLESAEAVLKRGLEIEELAPCVQNALLTTALRTMLNAVEQIDVKSDVHFDVIALEGLDGTGKSTLAKNLAMHLGAQTASTPGAWTEIDGTRKQFDSCRLPHLRRAFYFASNYALATRLDKAVKDVVVDRYFYSSVAYAAGSTVHNVDELPPVESEFWAWPETLKPRPKLVVLLKLSPEARHNRVTQRSLTENAVVTEEELRLAKDRRFEEAVFEAFRRCCEHNKASIPYILVDADLLPEVVMEKVLECL